VHEWLAASRHARCRHEERDAERMRRLTSDPRAVQFTMAFCDRVLRPESNAVAAAQLREVVSGPLPAFLSQADRLLLRLGAAASTVAAGIVMPLARRRLRQIVGDLIVDRADPGLHDHLVSAEQAGFAVNANLLGEFVLGDDEAGRRRQAIHDLLARDDVQYVSVKASSVTSQLNLWAPDHTLARVKDGLRPLLAAAGAATPAKFVNLDMEEFKDLRLTMDAFTDLLDEPAFHGLEAGIVLQAYLPDSFDALLEIVAWAVRRRAAGGAGVKIRIVKGANLAMERVDAAVHGWTPAPYATKAETDANYKRMLDWAMHPDRLEGVRLGVASHNLFDVAWARELAARRGVESRVEFEMLQGMAPGLARAVHSATGHLLLYTPIVAAKDFDSALAYLFRRLEENSSGENFLRHLFELDDADVFASEQRRFEQAVTDCWTVSASSRRHGGSAPLPDDRFANAPDTDPTDPTARAAVLAAVAANPTRTLPAEVLDPAAIDRVLATAREAAAQWRAMPPGERRRLLRLVGDELSARRAALIAVMAAEAGKTIAEGDSEVSEAIDFARYYAERIADLGGRDGVSFTPLGVVAVVPPWNFPMAIPAGGVFAALAAGNAVVLKPAPQTPRSAFAIAEAAWAAGIPPTVLQYVRGPDAVIGERLVGHPDLGGIVLTGSYETAAHFTQLAPSTPLFAETSGKNAIVVMPDADLDLAVADLVKSAFGHAGQKCSAASLAILVGGVATSERFRRQLVDATRSLVVATPDHPEAMVGPLVEAPSDKLHRAFTTLEAGQTWLLEPHRLEGAAHLWSPGLLDGVVPGSWFHQTECFGPVLGLVAAADLDDAIAVQNGVPFGLTGGIHTLDPTNVERWLDHVAVGNAYVNRAITGAIVQRQPFGGWKRSVVGPGAKAGGPNYVAALGQWRDDGLPTVGLDPSPDVARLVAAFADDLDHAGRARLDAAARSDAHWWTTEFTVDHDPTGLFCEANVFRYRPLPVAVVRIAADSPVADVARVLVAVTLTGSETDISVDPAFPVRLPIVTHRVEPSAEFVERMAAEAPPRVRHLGREALGRIDLPIETFLDDRPVVTDGRIELARYLREQAVSRTLHRFGNLVQAPPVA